MELTRWNVPDEIEVRYSGNNQSGTQTVKRGEKYTTPIGFSVVFSEKGYIHARLTGASNNQPKLLIVVLPEHYYLWITSAAHHGATNTGWAAWQYIRVSDELLPNLPNSVSQDDAFNTGEADYNTGSLQFWDMGRYIYLEESHGNFGLDWSVRIYPVAPAIL